MKKDSVAVLEYHLSDSYSTTDGNARATYYTIYYVPNAVFDGRDSIVGGSAGMYPQFLGKYNAAMSLQSPCTLNIFVDYNSTNRVLKVKAKATKVDAFANGRLRYAIAESYIPYNWGTPPDTQKSLRHVVRKMLPNYSGIVIPDTLHIGQSFVDSQTYTLSSAWKDSNCSVVVFVQRDDVGMLKPVLRSTKSKLFPTWVFGDATGDSVVNSADAVCLLNYLFVNGPPPNPLPSGDATRDCIVNAADVVYLLNYLFVSGPAPLRGCAWWW